jgi:hypothetical protein
MLVKVEKERGKREKRKEGRKKSFKIEKGEGGRSLKRRRNSFFGGPDLANLGQV